MKERIKWYFKQLLPLMYVSEYEERHCNCGKNEVCGNCSKNGKFVTVWRMWFGRCFNIETWEVNKKITTNTG